jgi:IclR family transcriptional regulator, KDG regulon repressor
MGNGFSRLAQVFDLLAESPRGLSVTELADRMGTSKSTSSRLLAALLEGGLVERDHSQRHFLDVRFWTWGVKAARRVGVLDIARPHMAAAVSKWRNEAYIAVMRGDQTIYLESVTLGKEDVLYNIISYVVPVYACAPGKAMLAFSDEKTINDVLNSELKQFTATTFATKESLAAEIERIRGQGYAVNRGEYYDNDHIAAAVPILDDNAKPVAAVSFYGMKEEATLERLVPPLIELGEVISSSLGYNKVLRQLVG